MNFLIMRTNKQNKNLHSLMDSNYAIWTGICGAGGAIIGMTVCGESKDLKELDLLR
jgi:multidrug transporter EmrE-like cation transporter